MRGHIDNIWLHHVLPFEAITEMALHHRKAMGDMPSLDLMILAQDLQHPYQLDLWCRLLQHLQSEKLLGKIILDNGAYEGEMLEGSRLWAIAGALERAIVANQSKESRWNSYRSLVVVVPDKFGEEGSLQYSAEQWAFGGFILNPRIIPMFVTHCGENSLASELEEFIRRDTCDNHLKMFGIPKWFQARRLEAVQLIEGFLKSDPTEEWCPHIHLLGATTSGNDKETLDWLRDVRVPCSMDTGNLWRLSLIGSSDIHKTIDASDISPKEEIPLRDAVHTYLHNVAAYRGYMNA